MSRKPNPTVDEKTAASAAIEIQTASASAATASAAAAAGPQNQQAAAAATPAEQATQALQEAEKNLNHLLQITTHLIVSGTLPQQPQALQGLSIKARLVMQQIDALQSLASNQPKLGFTSSIEQILGQHDFKIDPKLIQKIRQPLNVQLDHKLGDIQRYVVEPTTQTVLSKMGLSGLFDGAGQQRTVVRVAPGSQSAAAPAVSTPADDAATALATIHGPT